MTLTEQEFEEFQEIYKEDVGEDISIEEAREITFRLVDLYQLLAQPLPDQSGKRSTQP